MVIKIIEKLQYNGLSYLDFWTSSFVDSGNTVKAQ
jgi:hypothetical protein